MDEEQLQVDPLFAGLTRAAMVWPGVPLVGFVIEMVLVYCVFLLTKNPLLLLLFLVSHTFLYVLCSKDPGIFDDISLWFKTCGKCVNTKFWGSKSFSASSTERYREW